MSELGIVAKMQRISRALTAADLAHAFGGALALAWCVGEVRATMDIDVNVFIGADRLEELLEALPRGATWHDEDVAALREDGQARLRWGRHPVDVFLNTTAFHERAAERVQRETLAGSSLPFLACDDLAVFKAFYARPKDWVDLQSMLEAGSLEVARVLGTLVEHLGVGDERVARLRELAVGE